MNIISPTQKTLFSILADPKANLRIKKGIIHACDSKTINKICEFILNIFNGNIKISEEDYKRLQPYAKYCRQLLNRKIKIKEKKKFWKEKAYKQEDF